MNSAPVFLFSIQFFLFSFKKAELASLSDNSLIILSSLFSIKGKERNNLKTKVKAKMRRSAKNAFSKEKNSLEEKADKV
jgi:hypothetical protein